MDGSEAKKPSHEGNISSLVRKNCSQLFLVYAGLWRDFMPSAPDFLRQCGLGDRNMTILRDPSNSFFENGVSSEINSVEALLKWHYDFLKEQSHIDEVYSMGNSAGGYGAILYGCMLGIDKVYAFSPSGPLRLEHLQGIINHADGRTEVNVFYDPKHRRDAFFAEALGECKGVILHPSPEHIDDGHYVFMGMMERGELPNIFPPFKGSGDAAA